MPGVSRLLQKTLHWKVPEPQGSLRPSLPICPHSRPQPPGYPIWCYSEPHASRQSGLRLAGKPAFQDVEAVQLREGCKGKGHPRPNGYFDRTPTHTELRGLILRPWTLRG